MITKTGLISLMIFLCVQLANASCTYNGQEYPEGTVIGPYVCTDGQWK